MALEASVSATLSSESGRVLSAGRCEKLDETVEVAPGIRLHMYKTQVHTAIGDSSGYGSEGPAQGATLSLRGQARAMQLTVEAAGYARYEQSLRPKQADLDGGVLHVVVLLEKL